MSGRVTPWELSTSASFKDFPPDDVRKVLLTTTRTLEHQHADICFPRTSVCVSSILPYFPHFPVVELRKLLSVLPSLAPPCHFSLRFQRAAPIFSVETPSLPQIYTLYMLLYFIAYSLFACTFSRPYSACLQHLKPPKKRTGKLYFRPLN